MLAAIKLKGNNLKLKLGFRSEKLPEKLKAIFLVEVFFLRLQDPEPRYLGTVDDWHHSWVVFRPWIQS